MKKSFRQYQKAGLYSQVAEEVIRPSAEECVRNSRARSTKLRWAIRAEYQDDRVWKEGKKGGL